MRTVGPVEAKQKLSKLVDRASDGEHIEIARRGKLATVIAPLCENVQLAAAFAAIEKIRKRVKSHPGLNAKDLINEGRR